MNESIGSGGLKLIRNRRETRYWLQHWLDALTEDAEDLGKSWLLPEESLSFQFLRTYTRRLPNQLRVVFRMGGSPESAIIQINEPTEPGTEKPTTGIATDDEGRHYLVHQGRLKRNKVSTDIKGDDFTRRTGLEPIAMRVASGAAKREWFVVAPLEDVNADEIRYHTAEFMHSCWTARTWGQDAAADEAKIAELFGNDEKDGYAVFKARKEARKVRRVQGFVWSKLFDLLKAHGILMVKPKHARGYEVDAEIPGTKPPLLIEIKTSTRANDIYTATGQLTLYPQLLPRLAKHHRVLLVPGAPLQPLERALANTDIELHTFTLTGSGRNLSVTFSPAFLALCGIR